MHRCCSTMHASLFHWVICTYKTRIHDAMISTCMGYRVRYVCTGVQGHGWVCACMRIVHGCMQLGSTDQENSRKCWGVCIQHGWAYVAAVRALQAIAIG